MSNEPLKAKVRVERVATSTAPNGALWRYYVTCICGDVSESTLVGGDKSLVYECPGCRIAWSFSLPAIPKPMTHPADVEIAP
jgi:hypothetical protein